MNTWRFLLVGGLLACNGEEPDPVNPGPVESNEIPLAQGDGYTGRVDTPITFDPTENDSDPDGDTLTVVETTEPANGSVSVDGNSLTYTPASDFVGFDDFTYTIEDGQGGSARASVVLEIRPELAINVLQPVVGSDQPFGDVDVVLDVEGCRLGATTDEGCRILRTLDGEPATSTRSFAFTVSNQGVGPHVLSLQLANWADEPLDPPVVTDVTWTTLPPPPFEGDIQFTSNNAMNDFCANFNGVVTGNVSFAGFIANTNALSCLTNVGGTLTVASTALQGVSLPNLVATQGIVIRDNTNLSSLSMPALPSIPEVSEITDNPSLTSVDFSALETLPGGLTIVNNGLTGLSLPSLTSTGGLEVQGNPLTSFATPLLSTAGRLVLDDAAVATVDLGVLASVQTDLLLRNLPSLGDLSLPALQSADRVQVENVGSAAVSLPDLRNVQFLFVTDSANLTDLSVPLLPEGDLFLRQLPLLTTIDFSTWTADVLELNNVGLTSVSLTGLGTLTSVQVINNPNLTTLSLQGTASQSLSITGNPALVDATAAFATVVEAAISNNIELVTLDLGALTTTGPAVPGQLTITDNTLLETVDLSGLVTAPDRDFIINANPALVSLDLRSLQVVGSLEVSADTLPSLELGSLVTLSSSCVSPCRGMALTLPEATIVNLGLLESTPAFSLGLTTQLSSLSLPLLQSVTERIVLTGNTSLQSVSAPQLTIVGEDLQFVGNSLLSTIDMGGLGTTGPLVITDNDSLATFALANLTEAGRLDIQDNALLATFDLTSLASIGPFDDMGGGDLNISFNDVLDDLDGLTGLLAVDGDFTVEQNPLLPSNVAQDLANNITIGGTITITDNLP